MTRKPAPFAKYACQGFGAFSWDCAFSLWCDDRKRLFVREKSQFEGRSGITPPAFFMSTQVAVPVCSYCEQPITLPVPTLRAARKIELRAGVQITGTICPDCLQSLHNDCQRQDALAADLKVNIQNVVKIAQEAARRDDYESFAQARFTADFRLQEIEAEIKKHIAEIESLNASRQRLILLQEQIEQVLRASPSAGYFTRRREADAYIRRPDVRLRIFGRDKFMCCSCGVRTTLTIDHVLSVKHGGGDADENLQTLCRLCNSRKGARRVAA